MDWRNLQSYIVNFWILRGEGYDLLKEPEDKNLNTDKKNNSLDFVAQAEVEARRS